MIEFPLHPCRLSLTPESPRRALLHATGFLRHQTGLAWLEQPWSPWQRQVRSRVIGNWLGELDRLLHVVLDDAAPAVVAPVRPQVRNTARRLLALDADTDRHRPRLYGMSRAWAAYRFTGGMATRADVRGGATMTVGWSDGNGLRRFGLGEPLILSRGALAEICGFYEGLALQVTALQTDAVPTGFTGAVPPS